LIDLHCHILPGLDDGARDLADSLAMARQAEQDGIEVVCATPHLRADHDVRVEDISRRVASLQRALARRHIDVRVIPGAEVAASEVARLDERQLRMASIGGAGGWVLLEPSPGALGDEVQEIAAQLADRGLRAILAHPERHAGSDFAVRLRALAGAGVLIQWTAEFIAQADPDGPVMELAREGLVHLLGSDAHSSRAGRPLRLAAAFAQLELVRSAEQVAWSMTAAPRAIIGGEPVDPPP